jgi:hypothetical protein
LNVANRHATDERENYLSPEREEVRHGSSQGCYRFCRRTGPASPNAAQIVRKDGPMHAALSFLGAAMLILIGVVVVLATIILILYEACLIVRLGRRLTRGAATVESAGPGGEGSSDGGGGA